MTPERERELREAHRLMPSPMSTELFAEIDRLRAEVVALRDDPEWDATDAAHPAWWRGHDYVSARFKEELDKTRRERDESRAELAFIWDEYANAEEESLTRDGLMLKLAALKVSDGPR